MNKTAKFNKIFYVLIGINVLLLIFLISIYLSSSKSLWSDLTINATNVMKDIPSNKVTGIAADNLFIENTADFSIELFKITCSDADNTLISPISAMFPLAMTANGANGNTLSQMNQVLSKDIPLDTLNQYLYSFRKSLKSTAKSKMNISNSIWFRNGLEVQKDFLQTVSDYYDASVYQSPFNNQTVTDINNWIKHSTNGHFNKGLDGINSDSMMYLINTLEFDSKWREKYTKDNVNDDVFYNQNGSSTTGKFMSSTENYYLDDGKATGFIKPYYYDNYRFVALLPNEGISISEYINQMTGEQFINTLKNASRTPVYTETPEFHYENSFSLKGALTTLGMKDATSNSADFSNLSKSQGEGLFLENIIQKTYITVDPKGTKAGALTIVFIETKSDEGLPDKSVILNRPFVYAIIDSDTNIPIFLGVVSDLSNISE